MKKYTIAYQYIRGGKLEVEANSLEEAKELSMELSVDNEVNEFYVDGSYEINEEMTEEYNK